MSSYSKWKYIAKNTHTHTLIHISWFARAYTSIRILKLIGKKEWAYTYAMAWHAPNIYYLQCSCIHYQFDCYKFICIIRDSFRHIFTQMVDCWLVVVSLYSSIVFFSSLVFFCFVLFVSAYFHRVRFICTITLFRLRFRFHFNISMVDYVLERGTVVGVVVSSLLFAHNSTLFYCYVSAFRMTLINNPEDESVTWLNTRREEENEKCWKLKAFIRQRPHNATYLSVRIQRTIKPSHFTRMAHQLKKQTGRITMFTCLKEKSSTIITTATTTKTKFVYFPLENFHLRRSRKTKTKPKKKQHQHKLTYSHKFGIFPESPLRLCFWTVNG